MFFNKQCSAKAIHFLVVLIITLISLTNSGVSYSQTSTVVPETHSELFESLEGTYQIQMINVRYQPAIDTDLLRRIKSERKPNTQILINLSDVIKVKVLSQTEVDAGIRFSKNVAYLNE